MIGRRIEYLLWAIAISMFLMPQIALAYLDPASGSLVWQIVIGSLLGGMAAIRIYWRKLKSIFKPGVRENRSNGA
jgi:hypothetical protein